MGSFTVSNPQKITTTTLEMAASNIEAARGAKKETATKVQSPTDLKKQKGKVAKGKIVNNNKETDTQVSKPSALTSTMGKNVGRQGGLVNVSKPTAVIKQKAKPVTGKSIVAAALEAGGPGSGRKPGSGSGLAKSMSKSQQSMHDHLVSKGFAHKDLGDGKHVYTKNKGTPATKYSMEVKPHTITTQKSGNWAYSGYGMANSGKGLASLKDQLVSSRRYSARD